MAKWIAATWCLMLVLPAAVVAAGDQDCGAYALKSVLSVLGEERSVESLRGVLGITPKEGTSMLKIDEAARSMGYTSEAVRLLPADLLKMKRPAVAFVRGHHFVAVVAVDPARQEVLIVDEGKEPEWLSLEEFKIQWKGHLLIIGSSKSASGPRLWKHSEKVSVGQLLGVNDEKRSFTLLNTGRQELRISAPRFSCNCAVVQFEPEVVPPGGICRVQLNIDASAKPIGPFHLSLVFATNEGTPSHHRIELEGMVERRAKLFPSYFSLGDIAPGESEMKLSSKLFLGSNYKGAAPTVQEVGPGALRGVEVRESKKGPGWFDIDLVLDLNKTVCDGDGRFFHDAFIRTADKDYPAIQIGAVGRRLPWMTVFPGRVLLTGHVRGASIERRIRVVNRNGGALRAAADVEWVKTRVDGEEVEVTVTPPEGEHFKAVVRIESGETRVEVPIVGIGGRVEER